MQTYGTTARSVPRPSVHRRSSKCVRISTESTRYETLFQAFSSDLIHINPTAGTPRLLVINVHKCEITSAHVRIILFIDALSIIISRYNLDEFFGVQQISPYINVKSDFTFFQILRIQNFNTQNLAEK